MRGRKPKPTTLKIIEGNRGKRPIRETPELPPKPKPPRCPAWLEKEAKREWRRVAPELHALGLLSELDVVPLAVYCQAYARYAAAEQALSRHGMITARTNINGEDNDVVAPAAQISKTQVQIIRQFCTEFGLTPSSRGRLIVPGEKEEDPFDVFISEGRRICQS